MTTLALSVDVVTDEVLGMLTRALTSLNPLPMGAQMRGQLRNRFIDQARDAFASASAGGDGPAWESLSEWRVRDRGGSSTPIMSWTGELSDQVASFKGRLRIVSGGTGFSFWFPDPVEMSPKYWGLTAGQRRNPLGGTPLSATPRPVFSGVTRQTTDTVDALADYFRRAGFEVEV